MGESDSRDFEAGATRECPLRVLHVLAAARCGGLETVVLSLARGLRARGHDVRVACLFGQEDAPDDAHPFLRALDAAPVPRIALRRPARAYLAERRALARLLDREMPEIVHTHGYRADLQALGPACARRRRLVSTVHGFTGGDAKLRAYQWLQCRWLRRAHAVVAVSRPLREQLIASGIAPDRVHLIRNAWAGPGGALARIEARELLGLPASAFVIGWIGRLSHEKAPDLWLDAFERFADARVHGCFVGEGPEREALERRVRSGGRDGRVHFAGERPEASRLLSAFDVVVLSSHTEGTPIVLLEAMEAGVPVVATAVGGVPDVLSDREGWLVPPGDPRALADAVGSVRAHPREARVRAAAARARLATELSYAGWLDAYERLYRATARR